MRLHKYHWLIGATLAALVLVLDPFSVAAVSPVVVGMPVTAPAGYQLPTAHTATLPRPPDPFPYPIAVGAVGPVTPLLEAPLQYPFLCETEKSGLGQPLPDNQNGYGVPVYAEDAAGEKTSQIIGYSQDCRVPTRVEYYYQPVGKTHLLPWTPKVRDAARLVVNGATVPFIVRLERGTINRFIYAIAVLKGQDDRPERPDMRHWNRKLVYHFGGGVGIGRRQGKLTPGKVFDYRAEQLALGYAVVTSTGNHTSNHYNIQLSEDTALRLKRQFSARYGEPLYTVGVGGSGGGLQQYLLGQNSPGLLDAAIPQYAYPDMVTQTIYALDCELLEHYFAVTAADNPRWQDYERRRAVQGLNALPGVADRYRWLHAVNLAVQGRWPALPQGSSECAKSWRVLTPLVYNPRFDTLFEAVAPAVRERVNWTYWDDLEAVYGHDDDGHARRTWDNTGVQYGLVALRQHQITIEEFLDLNARIGGWKAPHAMQAEHVWLPFGKKLPLWFSLWSAHNIHLGDSNRPAPRTAGSVAAMQAAYLSGQVFIGRIDIPVIDVRHYLEPQLDMHHTSASLAARLRMQQGQGHADNQLIWSAPPPHDLTPRAFAVIDAWLTNLRAHPQRGVVGNKPAEAADLCATADGELLAQGPTVWDGDWNDQPPGACSRAYPAYSTPRSAAGAPLAGDMFKCHLQSVEAAIAQGVYAPHDLRPYVERLQAIFPDGVCDYRQPDAGRPAALTGL